MATTPPQQPTTPTQPTKKNWPLIILLLMAVGVPSVAGIAFTEQITQHPWQALGLALLYEFLVLILGFIGKVWQSLESRWVEKAADWVDMRVRAIFSGYRRRYLQHLRYRHRDFDVKGLSTQGIFTLELERVFVELTIVPRPPHKTSADPIRQIPPELRAGRHTIWDYLHSETLANQGLAVIGPPGSGKTTLLKHMTLTLAGKRQLRKRHNAPDKLPVLIFLRDHAQVIKDAPELSLAQTVRDGLTKQGGPEAPPGWFQRQLARGRCLVMLDGLDEVADPDTRKLVVDWVERQMAACSKNRFVVTSRPHGYRATPLTNVAVLEVAPFDRAQVRRFVDNWYLANEAMSTQKDDPGVRMKAREGANDLLRRILGSSALAALAVNPLLLTMISGVHRYRSTLPGRRVELYAEICDVFLGKRQAAKGVAEDLTPVQKRCVLQPLAYHLMQEEQREILLAKAVDVITETLARVGPGIPGADFLKMIENSSGLLVERESGVYGFAHKTFQEYLASIHIQEARLESRLLNQVENTWWHEAIRLYCAQADATSVIQACLKEDPPSIPALVLAIECLNEAREVQPQIRAQLESVLDEGVEDENPERRRIVAEALLSLRLQRMVRVSDDRYVDPTPITHAEYQLFLDEQLAQGKYYQPDHWQDLQFPGGIGRAPVVGVRSLDAIAFCRWLTRREVGPWQYRLPQMEEVEIEQVASKPNCVSDAVAHWCMTKDDKVVISAFPLPSLSTELLKEQIDTDRVRARAPTSPSSNLTQAYVLTRAFTRGSNRIHALDRVLERVRAYDLDLAGISDLARALDLASNPTRDLAHSRDLIRNFNRNLDSIRTRDLYFRDRALALDLALALRDFTRDLIRGRARARIRDLGLTLAHDLRDRTRALNLALDVARDLDLNCTRNLSRAHNLARARALDPGEVLDLVRWRIRLAILAIAANLQSYTRPQSMGERLSLDKRRAEIKAASQELTNAYLNLYVDLAILEARIRGELPAFEGICIVKERIKDETTGT